MPSSSRRSAACDGPCHHHRRRSHHRRPPSWPILLLLLPASSPVAVRKPPPPAVVVDPAPTVVVDLAPTVVVDPATLFRLLGYDATVVIGLVTAPGTASGRLRTPTPRPAAGRAHGRFEEVPLPLSSLCQAGGHHPHRSVVAISAWFGHCGVCHDVHHDRHQDGSACSR